MILPLMGRLRNASVDYVPFMCWATNPMYNHGIYHWIKDFYLDAEGIPKAETSNVERYFVLQNGQPVWFNTREDAEAIYGPSTESGIRSFRSIRAHVTDNKPLLKNNSDYISNLKALPEIKRRIFLDGSWTAREEEAGLYNRSWVTMVPYPDLSARRRVRSWDTSSSPVSSQSPDPDWTRGVLVSKSDTKHYTIEDLVSIRDRPYVVEELIYATARRDGPGVTVVYSLDAGSAGVARANEIRKKLAEMGINCKLVRPSKSKRVRFLPFSAIAESGFVQVVKADWNEEFHNELEEFSGLKPRERDDIADAVSDAVHALNQGVELPDFNLPELQGTNPFGGMLSLGSPTYSTNDFPTFNI